MTAGTLRVTLPTDRTTFNDPKVPVWFLAKSHDLVGEFVECLGKHLQANLHLDSQVQGPEDEIGDTENGHEVLQCILECLAACMQGQSAAAVPAKDVVQFLLNSR